MAMALKLARMRNATTKSQLPEPKTKRNQKKIKLQKMKK